MLGIFGTLNLGVRSLATQQQAMEVAGHNLANVNTPGYARQRLDIETTMPVSSAAGWQGTGAEGVRVTQIRDYLLDRQIQAETSILGSLEAQQQALQYAQANLGQEIDRQATGAEGAAAAAGVGGQNGLAEDLSDLFTSFQSLSANPTSLVERQVLIIQAQKLTTQFNQVMQRFDDPQSSPNVTLLNDVDRANELIADVAKLNQQIISAEAISASSANDLRDVRQQRLEDLGELVNLTVTTQANGAADLSIGGVAMTNGTAVLDKLEAFDAGGGRLLVRAQSEGTTLSLTSGSIQGTIEVRDGPIANLRDRIDTLASQLIEQVNAIHRGGYGLDGTTGEDFFTGTDAASIRVNANLVADPGRIQAAGAPDAVGDNQVALALAQLGDQPIAALRNQTFSENYAESVAALGATLSSVNTQINNQNIVNEMLLRQRDSTSGVSLDEEVTDLLRYQKAFQASARLITTLDEMLTTVVNLKR